MTNRKLVIALVASTALNLFLVGAVVGGLVIGHRFADGRRGGHGQPLFAAVDSLSPQSRQAYRQLLRGEAGEVGQQMRQGRRARAEAWRKLGADPAAATQVKQDLAQARTGDLQARAALEEKIVDFVAGLPADERAPLAEAMARSGPALGPGRRRPPPPP